MRTDPRQAKLLVGALSLAGLLAVSPIAAAQVQTFGDGHGRTITLDVQTEGVDGGGYAGILRSAIHGDEIETVTTRVVAPQRISSLCGSGAAACYRHSGGRGTIIVPARATEDVRHALLHEYGHHVDFSIDTPQATARGGDGTPSWWDSRAVARLLAQGEVAYDYSLGWSRSIAEIYAEDYVQAHGPARFGISWLSRPSDATLDALRRDVLGSPPPRSAPAPALPTPDPPGSIGAEPRGTASPARAGARPKAGKVKRGRTRRVGGRVVTRYSGFVRGGRAVSIRLGARSGRRVGLRVVLRRADRRSALRTGTVCGRRTLGVRTARRGRAALLSRRLRAGRCRIVVRNPGAAPVRFRAIVGIRR